MAPRNPRASHKSPMAQDHELLAQIRAGIQATGTHRHHWGELRREVFPGQIAWLSLKAWCADNQLECELVFGQSSKAAEVQFSRQRKAQGPLAPAAL